VVTGQGYSTTTPGALRGGGFTSARINAAAPTKHMEPPVAPSTRWATTAQNIPVLGVGTKVTSKHEIDGVTSGNIWGNGAINSGVGKSITLECASCHDPHGNGNYRILRSIPVDSGAAVAVNIPDASVKKYETTNYWLSGDTNVPAGGTALAGTATGTGDGYIQNVAAWCTTCHTRYLAPSKSYKTPSGDVQLMYRHRSDANYKAGAANCITCHVSHGSNAAMAGSASTVGLPGQPTTVDASTDSKLLRVNNRGTCVMCHNV